MLTANKGEWSEIYTLLKVISEKQIFAGDSNLNKIENLIFPVIKILRDETHGTFEFSYMDSLVLVNNGKSTIRIPIAEFHENACFLLNELKKKTQSSFSIPIIENFINSFGSHSIKAKSTVKSDIRIIIHDPRTGTNPELGFSIKSQLGSAATLLNAGRTTNFIYQIDKSKLTQTDISEINSINSKSKIKDRLKKLSQLKVSLNYKSTESIVFENNLTLIDSALPKIISEILILFFTTNYSKLSDLITEISERNPLEFNLTNRHPFYLYKVKRLLTDIALGMTPSRVWEGQIDATGGYLVVKNNGEILCYHIYNRNEFEDYLLQNTKLDTASSTRHNFGEIYEDKNQLYFKLNLQIRFL